MFSWIQYHILLALTQHAECRYSQLRPQDVESNLFAYHLKGLLAEDLIEKTDNSSYRLTAKGLNLAGTISLRTGRPRQQPKILNAIICRNQNGKYLMSRWRRQPNIGLVSFPHGMMHYGEPVNVAVERELAEKAGLWADLRYRGDVYVRGERSGEIDRHMLVHLFEASHVRPGAEDQLRLDVSEHFWSPLDGIAPEMFVPGFYEIAQIVAKNPDEIIFADIAVEVNIPRN